MASFRCRLLCLVFLFELAVQQQVRLALQMNPPRVKNTIHLNCVYLGLGRLTPNDQIDFFLNHVNVSSNDLRELRKTRINRTTIHIEVESRYEGYFTCVLYNMGSVVSTSDQYGPITADPHYSVNGSVPLIYVGVIGESVTLQSVIPLGDQQQLYSYTWLNQTSTTLNEMDRYHVDTDGDLTIMPLWPSDNGSYALRVDVGLNPIMYTNNGYQLFVQEQPNFNNNHSNSTNLVTIICKGQPADPITISCSAQGYPNVYIEWMHNEKLVRTNGDKYQVTTVPSQVHTANSTLRVGNLSASDNGVVQCIASVRGCSLNHSNTCHQEVFNQTFITKLSVITDDFQYQVIILGGKNIELRIELLRRAIPVAVQIHIQYTSEEDAAQIENVTSPGSYTNTTQFNVYIPTSYIPTFKRFKVQIALGSDADTIGPYRSPIRDMVYDIDDPNGSMNLYKIIVIVIGTILGVVVIGCIPAILVLLICSQSRKTKVQEAENEIKIGDEETKNKIKIEAERKNNELAIRAQSASIQMVQKDESKSCEEKTAEIYAIFQKFLGDPDWDKSSIQADSEDKVLRTVPDSDGDKSRVQADSEDKVYTASNWRKIVLTTLTTKQDILMPRLSAIVREHFCRPISKAKIETAV